MSKISKFTVALAAALALNAVSYSAVAGEEGDPVNEGMIVVPHGDSKAVVQFLKKLSKAVAEALKKSQVACSQNPDCSDDDLIPSGPNE